MEKQSSEMLKTLSKNQRLARFAVSETGFLFDPETGQSFTLNKTGLITLNHLKYGDSVEETAAYLAKQYKVPLDVALSSVEAFLIQLGRYI